MNYEPLLLSVTMRITPGRVHIIAECENRMLLRSIDIKDGSMHVSPLHFVQLGCLMNAYPFVWHETLHFIYTCDNRIEILKILPDGSHHSLCQYALSSYPPYVSISFFQETDWPIDCQIGHAVQVAQNGRICFVLQCDGYDRIIWVNMYDLTVTTNMKTPNIDVNQRNSLYSPAKIVPTCYDRQRDVHYAVYYDRDVTFKCAAGRMRDDRVIRVDAKYSPRDIGYDDNDRLWLGSVACCDGKIIASRAGCSIEYNIDDGSAVALRHANTRNIIPARYMSDALVLRPIFVDADVSSSYLQLRDARTGDKYAVMPDGDISMDRAWPAIFCALTHSVTLRVSASLRSAFATPFHYIRDRTARISCARPRE